jgi:hypothetical protein
MTRCSSSTSPSARSAARLRDQRGADHHCSRSASSTANHHRALAEPSVSTAAARVPGSPSRPTVSNPAEKLCLD